MRIGLIVVLFVVTAVLSGVFGYAQNVPMNAPATIVGSQSQESLKDCTECPEMIVVPAGTFRMGAAAGEKGRPASGNEGPQHEVTLGAPSRWENFTLRSISLPPLWQRLVMKQARSASFAKGRGARSSGTPLMARSRIFPNRETPCSMFEPDRHQGVCGLAGRQDQQSIPFAD
jgi:hypothetical protein